MPKTIIILAGPTAVGKTAVAIQLAQHFQTEIISADSRQCFKELNIGVARPSAEELAAVPHHFIASHSIEDEINAAVFAEYAHRKAAEIFKSKDVLIMAGGTGLYIRAFAGGLDPVPATDPAIREKIQQEYNQNGIGWLQSQLQKKDPHFAEKGEMQNPQRMMRALEVMEQTGQSVLSFHTNSKTDSPFQFIRIGLQLPRDILRERIAIRVQQMIEAGLEAEVKSLEKYKQLNALQTVGYAELFEYFDGKISKETAVQQIIDHTRQYAKRQMTWFNKYGELEWFSSENKKEILAFTKAGVKKA